jgi:hypothetical protein
VFVFALAILLSGIALWLIPRLPRGGVLITVIVLAAVALQLNTLRYLNGDPGGDAYYYLVAANQLAHGENPLADWSFRLPFYPALLIPAILPAIPDLLWGRLVGVAATVGIIILLPLLARRLGFHPVVGVLAAVLLFFNTDFVITSIRPRPHAVFTFLLLLSIVMLFKITTVRQALAWGVVLGLMGITRQEAFPAIAILGITFMAALAAQRLSVKRIVRLCAAAAVPLFLILLPFFFENIRQYGNPVDSPYFHQTDTPTAWSKEQLRSNFEITRHKLARAYLPASEPGISRKIERNLPLIFGAALLLYLAWHAARRCSPLRHLTQGPLIDLLSLAVAVAFVITLGQYIFAGGTSVSQMLNIVIVAAGSVGLIELVRVGRWRGAVVVAIALVHLAIALWFNPLPRLFYHVFPTLALAAAAALLPLVAAPALPRWRQALRLSPLIFALALLGTAVLTKLDVAIDDLNYPAAPYYVATEAAEELEHFPAGNVAAEVDYEQGDGIFSLHSYQQNKFALFQEDLPPSAQWQWLCTNDIRYVVDNDDLHRLTVLTDENFQDRFQFRFDKKTIGDDNQPFRISVHEITARERCS